MASSRSLLEVAVLNAEEIQDVGVLQEHFEGDLVLRPQRRELGFGDALGLAGERGPLVEHAVDLRAECAHAPALDAAPLSVENARAREASSGSGRTKWSQVNRRDSVATIGSSGKASTNWTMRRSVFSEKPRP
ncbi:hypothetical protein WMF46_46670 [Sorangium sp. So ce117]